jgi:hypothetical protein
MVQKKDEQIESAKCKLKDVEHEKTRLQSELTRVFCRYNFFNARF